MESHVDCLVADREFIGDKWLGFLNVNRFRYHIGIRENYWVTIPRHDHCVKAVYSGDTNQDSPEYTKTTSNAHELRRTTHAY